MSARLRNDIVPDDRVPPALRPSSPEVYRPDVPPAFTGRTALALLAVGMVLLWAFGFVAVLFFV